MSAPRTMCGGQSDEKEERAFIGRLHKSGGLLSDDVVGISAKVLHPALIAEVACPCLEKRVGAAYTEPGIEARRRQVFVAKMPLAGESGAVSRHSARAGAGYALSPARVSRSNTAAM